MTHIALANLSTMQKYWLITGSVGPRPIALVTSLNCDGLCNAAPYSAFNYMGEDPPLFAIAIDHYGEESHRPGEMKDTLKNIVEREQFVVNMVDEAIVERAVQCGSDFPAHVSEPEAVGLSLAASTSVSVPRVSEAPIAWECRLYKVLEFSKQRSIVFGEIVGMVIREDLLDAEKLRIRVDRFEPYGRLGGPNYCRSTDRVQLRVPTYMPAVGVARE
ncbi:2-nitrobenzoate nitroreductase [Paraburkholderia piptadeniae]|uniref:2-nitrobenzoate nitroreductase n=1 Tax=Paraburkholderia piptadeniae TaxID=1701573 RepID=A0A1N7SJJ7_9BURK|nr:flavin reductase family protein [Paraburkholderia piptadeniae]SIT47601.1 2-nitrobenzoate nitroreductase [Paraburkholderia piptadeniae]